MDEFYYPDELEIGSADYENATFKFKKMEAKGLEEFIEKNNNENTSKKTASDLKVWDRFCSNIDEKKRMEDIPPNELDTLLGYFFKDIKKENGSSYEPDYLTSFHRSFGRYLCLKKVPFDILFDKEFVTSRSTLAARRKELRKKRAKT